VLVVPVVVPVPVPLLVSELLLPGVLLAVLPPVESLVLLVPPTDASSPEIGRSRFGPPQFDASTRAPSRPSQEGIRHITQHL
jgi:hypothetical protein